jgi:transposase
VYSECVNEDDGFRGHFVCVHEEEIVDTSEQPVEVRGPRRKNRWRTKAERRAIVEETLGPEVSVSRVARRHDVNANQLFHWRKLYREGRLGETTKFLPVAVAKEPLLEARKEDDFIPGMGTIEIKLSQGTLRILGSVDVTALRTVLECLVR